MITGSSTYPPFPDNVPTHPLVIVDYQLLKFGDSQEASRLWDAATQLGFWYLTNHGLDLEVERMFDMGCTTLSLPLEEKMNYEQGDAGCSFGYKAKGTVATDATGTRDNVEFLNISTDDVLAWPSRVHRNYPCTVNAHMVSTIGPFVQKSIGINNTILQVLNDKLGLVEGALAQRHSGRSPSEARCIRSAPNLTQTKLNLGAHTDFGSLTLLHNKIGGLQVLPPGAIDWHYIKPLPGHMICNIGDALSIFSGGILRSNLHRVCLPPGAQKYFERWSLAYFTRPDDDITLRPLSDESRLIADAVSWNSMTPLETGETSYQWCARRVRNHRLNNRKGPESWLASRGTEARL